jgi:hypothetical protein
VENLIDAIATNEIVRKHLLKPADDVWFIGRFERVTSVMELETMAGPLKIPMLQNCLNGLKLG